MFVRPWRVGRGVPVLKKSNPERNRHHHLKRETSIKYVQRRGSGGRGMLMIIMLMVAVMMMMVMVMMMMAMFLAT